MGQIYNSKLEIFMTLNNTISVYFGSTSQTVRIFHLETVQDMSNLVLICNTLGPNLTSLVKTHFSHLSFYIIPLHLSALPNNPTRAGFTKRGPCAYVMWEARMYCVNSRHYLFLLYQKLDKMWIS